MMEFKFGDRIRVRDLPNTRLDAGKTATVLWVRMDAGGMVLLYHVRLDGEDELYSVFAPHELEPESQGKP